MRRFGYVLLAVAVLLVIYGISMDTSVETSFGTRVANVSLMSMSSQLTNLGGILTIASLVAIIFGGKKAALPSQTRKCPLCSESILREAVKCRYCGADVEPVARESLESFAERLGIKKIGDLYGFGDMRFKTIEEAVDYAKGSWERS